LWAFIQGIPPKDATVLKQFNARRSDFEKLRVMLQEDSAITQVATYGVSTTNRAKADVLPPEQAGLHRARYEEYLATLKRAGAILAVHLENGEFYFPIRRWGFAEAGWGIAVVSRATAPTNRVASLDDRQKIPYSSGGVYRHVDGDWYLWMK
jgi:hypothetical protein